MEKKTEEETNASQVTIEVGFIRGQRGSAWRNDAYAVRAVNAAGEQELIGVVPADELQRIGFTADLIQPAFEFAVAKAGLKEKKVLHCVAKDRLDASVYPKPGRVQICL